MAFFLVFAAACLIMGSGLRTQVVEVLIKAGAPPELITAVSPDMVLGESLSSAPTIQAVREVPATVEGPVQADKDEDDGLREPVTHPVRHRVCCGVHRLCLRPLACPGRGAEGRSREGGGCEGGGPTCERSPRPSTH